MAGNTWSTDNLLANIKRRAFIPTTSTGPTTVDILDLANSELQAYITPLMMRTREEYKATIFDGTTTVNQDNYDIPTRAIGNKIKMVEVKDTTTFRVLPYLEAVRIPRYSTTGQVTGFWLLDDQIHFMPAPGQNVPYRIHYFIRSGTLVSYSSVGEVTAGK